MKSLPPIAAILAIVLLLIGGYVGAYLGMGERFDQPLVTFTGVPDYGAMTTERVYSHKWAPAVFAPAAWIESRLRGAEVRATTKPDFELLIDLITRTIKPDSSILQPSSPETCRTDLP